MVKRYLSLITFDEALHLLKTSFAVPGRTECVPVTRSLGRVIATPVYAQYSVPEVNLAAMDGIAVKSRDTIGASDQTPVTLKEFARVNTGNIVPPQFDAVIMIEDTWEAEDKFQIRKAAAPWQHVRPAGEDIREGRLVLPTGHQVRAFDIGALATYGIADLNVRTVHIGIIPTGSELVPLGIRQAPGRSWKVTRSWRRYFSNRWEHTVPASLSCATILASYRKRSVRRHRRTILSLFRRALRPVHAIIRRGPSGQSGNCSFTVSQSSQVNR